MVEKELSGKIDFEDTDLDVLDKAVDKAKKVLQKAKRAVRDEQKTPAAQFFERIEKEKVTTKEGGKKEKKGKLENLLQSDLGTKKAGQALSFFQNPTGVLSSLIVSTPVAAALIGAPFILKGFIQKLEERGGLLDRFFRDKVETRVDALRDKLVQQQIVAGFTQLIITSRSGSTSPRQSYNTFELRNNDRERLEEDFSVRNSVD